MGELLARAFTEQALLDAWEEVRDAALADGQGGAELDRFEAKAARRISELAAELADGRFHPHPVTPLEVAKHHGGVRRLGVPCLEDRVVERALLAELDGVIDPLLLPWSFAYRRGLGVRDALACLAEAREAGAAWVARAANGASGCIRVARCRHCCATSTWTTSTGRCSPPGTG